MRILNSGLDTDSEDFHLINSFAEQYGEAYIATYKMPDEQTIIRIIDERILPLESSPLTFNSIPVLTRSITYFTELSFDFTNYHSVPSSHIQFDLCLDAASELPSLIVDCCYAIPRVFTKSPDECQVVLFTSVLSIFYRPLGRNPDSNDLLISHRGFPIHYVVDPVVTATDPVPPELRGTGCLKPGCLIKETQSQPNLQASNGLVACDINDSSQLALVTASHALSRPNSTLIDVQEAIVATGLVLPPQDELTNIIYQSPRGNTALYITADVALVPLSQNVRFCNLHLLEESDWAYCIPLITHLQGIGIPSGCHVTWNGNYRVLDEELLQRVTSEGILVFLRRPNHLLTFGKIDHGPTLARRLEFQVNSDGTASCATSFVNLNGVFSVGPLLSGYNLIHQGSSGSLVADFDGNMVGIAIAYSHQLSFVSLLEPVIAHFCLEIPAVCQCGC
ncbi:hypothetical protein RCL1_003016 [Eukaryota sp. TZLM3-RCL]